MIHEETVDAGTLSTIRKMAQDPMLKDFVLVGGTALALQLGHRKSVDIDLFSEKGFDAPAMARHLESTYSGEITGTTKGSVFARIGNVRTGLIEHPYETIAPLIQTDGVRMASIDDLGAMKMHAIVSSGKRAKDFVDMYYILEHRNLDDVMRAYTAKYPGTGPLMARYGLLYHDELAFETDMKMLLKPFKWKEIAERMARAISSPMQVFKQTVGKGKNVGDNDLGIKQNKGKRL